MSELWPIWRSDDAPRDGHWFTARKGLSGYITRAKFDPEKIILGTAASDRIVGAFVDEAGNEVVVGQWWPEGEGQPAVPTMEAPTFNVTDGMVELNGAKIPREHYATIFSELTKGDQR